ncbi:hypothetical protein ACFIQF_13240 [Comamonas sp. J-3]|uniref:hypothetical protein n=1 Tax=Comamonas trifloxystrobinivorans TaxID=3350256 RepID=UPI00372BB3AC
MTEKIAWEKHPVSPERKAELRAAGFKIIDARFKPVEPGGDGILPDSKQREILIADLKEKGIEFDDALPTDELRALSVPLGQAAPAKRGRKPAQPQE